MKSFLLATLLLSATVATAAPITIQRPYSHPTAAPGVPAVGFVTLSNPGPAPDRLIAASSPLAERIEIHQTLMQDGVMKMRAQPDGVALPVGGTVALAPGGLHLMLFGLRQLLVEGQTLPVTLRFERAGSVEVRFKVEPRAAASAEEPHSHQHH